MPKHKTTYIAWRYEPQNPMIAEPYGVLDWTIEAWNSAHAARIARKRHKIPAHERIAVVPARFFSDHR